MFSPYTDNCRLTLPPSVNRLNAKSRDDIETVINSLCEELVAKDTENHTDERNRINNCKWNCSKTGRNHIAHGFNIIIARDNLTLMTNQRIYDIRDSKKQIEVYIAELKKGPKL